MGILGNIRSAVSGAVSAVREAVSGAVSAVRSAFTGAESAPAAPAAKTPSGTWSNEGRTIERKGSTKPTGAKGGKRSEKKRQQSHERKQKAGRRKSSAKAAVGGNANDFYAATKNLWIDGKAKDRDRRIVEGLRNYKVKKLMEAGMSLKEALAATEGFDMMDAVDLMEQLGWNPNAPEGGKPQSDPVLALAIQNTLKQA